MSLCVEADNFVQAFPNDIIAEENVVDDDGQTVHLIGDMTLFNLTELGLIGDEAIRHIRELDVPNNQLLAKLARVPDTESHQFIVKALASAQKAEVIRRELGCSACPFLAPRDPARQCKPGATFAEHEKRLSDLTNKAARIDTAIKLRQLIETDESGFVAEFMDKYSKTDRLPLTATALTGELETEVINSIEGIGKAPFAQNILKLEFKPEKLSSAVLTHTDKQTGKRFLLLNLTPIEGNNHSPRVMTQASIAEWVVTRFDQIKKAAEHGGSSGTVASYGTSLIDVGSEQRGCQKFKLKQNGSLNRLVGYSLELKSVEDSFLVIFATVPQANNEQHDAVDMLLGLG